jgi:hypothetical protein
MPISPYLDGEQFDAETRRALQIAPVSLRLSDRSDFANEGRTKDHCGCKDGRARPRERCAIALMRRAL